MKQYKNITLFQNGSIGDFLMAVFLAERLYSAEISKAIVIVVPRGKKFLETFVGCYPYISIVEVSRARPLSLLQLLPLLGPSHLGILQPTPGRIPLQVKIIAYLLTRLPGSTLVGFLDSDTWAKHLYSVALTYDISVPFVQTIYKIIESVGIVSENVQPVIRIVPSEEIHEKLGIRERRYVFIHPRGSSEKRSFTPQELIEIVNVLIGTQKLYVVISCSAAEESWALDVMSGLENSGRCVLACGLSGPELAALIKGAANCIGVDTGIMHLACLMKVPILVVAHKGTINWLPYYSPDARILYRIKEDAEVHEDMEHLYRRAELRLKPFGRVPNSAVLNIIKDWR